MAKRLALTATGLDALRTAPPLGIAIQERLFGTEGRPGGNLLATLVAIDRDGRADADPDG